MWYTSVIKRKGVILMNEDVEEFRPIEEFPGYEVGSLGNIKSYLKYPEGRLLSINYNKHVGYNYISLRKPDGDYKTMRLNRIVAKAFVPNPDNLPAVDHINDNSRDDRACNLQWLSNRDNNMKGGRAKRAGKTLQKNQIERGITTKVTAYKDDKYLYFDSIIECSRQLNIDCPTVTNMVNGKGYSKSLNGYQVVKQGHEDEIDKNYHPVEHVSGRIKGTKDGVTTEFESVREASRKIGLNRKSISRSLKKNARLRSGWNFEYIN